ncbi:MAG: hypothetical protein IPG84_12300 [Betaproteobacteria bacterium]|nr:hypothetical protein [Betaproteobacteria bacterium]
MATLNAIQRRMHPRARALAGGRIDAVFFCPHTADARFAGAQAPPATTLIEAGRRFGAESARSRASGDGLLRDLQATEAASAGVVLVPKPARGEEDAAR